MKKLIDILSDVAVLETKGLTDVSISAIEFDSRLVTEGALFVAVSGTQVDGHQFISKAISLGADVVVCEIFPDEILENITYLKVKNSAKALGQLASSFFDHPSRKLKLVGITGTNGKTTCATLCHRLFMELGHATGLLSTIENKIDDRVIPSTHTTPNPVELNRLLSEMVNAGCTFCFMEVSSHAIVQERISGLTFAGAAFTNISHDHLDYHGTFDHYIAAKKKFFDDLDHHAFALTNIDDKRGNVMLQNTKASKHTYALKSIADFKARVLTNSFEGLELDINGKVAWFRLVGDFNAYNLLCIYAIGMLLGEEEEEVLLQLSMLNTANGRFDVITKDGITAIVDYAHTPDALENVLKTINKIRTGNEQLITVIGCGGNRDKTKRPLMAEIACHQSTKVVLTSDNPRDEDPAAIIEDMKKGVPPIHFKKTLSITDRKEGIKTACMLAEQGDIILVAGKGHEDYQEINGVKHHFDDKEILNELL